MTSEATHEFGDADKTPDHGSLTLQIVIAIVAAVALSLLLPTLTDPGWVPESAIEAAAAAGEDAPSRPWTQVLVEDVFEVGGEIFLNLLFMLVVPLVVLSVMAGILSLGDVRKLGRPGLYAILYYLCTTVLAVFVGLVLANIFRPGIRGDVPADADAVVVAEGSDDADDAGRAELDRKLADAEQAGAPQTVGSIIRNLIGTIFTKNLIVSASEQQLLPLILFSIVFAAVLTTRLAASQTLQRVIVEAADALMAVVMLIMRIAPLGIFCLVAGRFGEASLKGEFLEKLSELGWYAATVTVGLMFHALITLPLIYWMIRGENPYRFLMKMSKALLTAFGTSSSSATLPVTIETATDEAGVSRKAAGFVLPLGATINMDGTALYEATAALFIAQLAGLDMTLTTQITIAVTATLAAIGAAGVPEAGLVTMLIVLKAIGFSDEECRRYVATIIPIDWLLDRIRTTVNVFGDATGAAVLTPQLPDHHGDVPTESTAARAAGADPDLRPTNTDGDSTVAEPRARPADEPTETVPLSRADLDAARAGEIDDEPSITVELPRDELPKSP